MRKIHINKEYEPPEIDYYYWRKIYKKNTIGGRSKTTCTNCLMKLRCKDHTVELADG